MLWSYNNLCVMYVHECKAQSFTLPHGLNLLATKVILFPKYGTTDS